MFEFIDIIGHQVTQSLFAIVSQSMDPKLEVTSLVGIPEGLKMQVYLPVVDQSLLTDRTADSEDHEIGA